jgi:hypothetical protein
VPPKGQKYKAEERKLPPQFEIFSDDALDEQFTNDGK